MTTLTFRRQRAADPPSWFARVIARQSDPSGAAVALRERLADRPLPENLSATVTETIVPFGVRTPAELGEQRAELLTEALESAITEDGRIPSAALNALHKFGSALGYSDRECSRVLNDAGESLYSRAVRSVVLDGKLTSEESAFLSQVASTLGLPRGEHAEQSDRQESYQPAACALWACQRPGARPDPHDSAIQ